MLFTAKWLFDLTSESETRYRESESGFDNQISRPIVRQIFRSKAIPLKSYRPDTPTLTHIKPIKFLQKDRE